MEKGTPKCTKALPIYRRMVPLLYLVALVAMTAIVLLNLVMKEPNTPDQFGLTGFAKMDSGWYTKNGEFFEIAEIDNLRTDGSDTVSIYHQLPGIISKDESIVFRSKNSTVTVLVGGVQIYKSEVARAPFYNHSPGTRWNMATVHKDDAGKTVELQVRQAYQDGRAKVDNFYYGDRASITLGLIQDKLWGCVISLLIFFMALVFFTAWLVLNWRRNPKNNSLLWLAVFAMIASCWCLLETNVFQFFVQDLQLIQVLDNMMLVIGGLPLFLYMDSNYHVFKFRAIRILCGLDVAYLLLATLSQMLGLWDYHQTLNGAVATFGIVIVILIFCLIRQRRQMLDFAAKSDRFFYYLQQIGILMLGLGLLGDLVRYLAMDVLDRAFIIRLGLLFFIICFGAGNIYQMILLVKKGMESELISQLAYSDGLTKTGNRTAYLEKLQHLVSEHPNDELGLVMFDINNLKWVNDTFGHKAGDELLLACADILSDSFSPPWNIFRIGGDEFVALTCGKGVRTSYETAAAQFRGAISRLSAAQTKKFPIVIAHGAAFSPVITNDAIEKIEKEADRRMYKDKYQLKCAEKQGCPTQ